MNKKDYILVLDIQKKRPTSYSEKIGKFFGLEKSVFNFIISNREKYLFNESKFVFSINKLDCLCSLVDVEDFLDFDIEDKFMTKLFKIKLVNNSREEVESKEMVVKPSILFEFLKKMESVLIKFDRIIITKIDAELLESI